MGRRSKYPAEVRERAVRMAFEHQSQHESRWAAICSIAEKMGLSAETLEEAVMWENLSSLGEKSTDHARRFHYTGNPETGHSSNGRCSNDRLDLIEQACVALVPLRSRVLWLHP